MKRFIGLLLLSYCLIESTPFIPRVTGKTKPVLGVFDGRTPCQDLAKQLNEKVIPECTKIKWRLVLYVDSITGNATTYSLLGFVYKKDNPRVGRWHIIKGTKATPEAIVYQLDLAGGTSLFLQRGGNNVLFFLDQEKNLMVGDRDLSYTLNRTSAVP